MDTNTRPDPYKDLTHGTKVLVTTPAPVGMYHRRRPHQVPKPKRCRGVIVIDKYHPSRTNRIGERWYFVRLKSSGRTQVKELPCAYFSLVGVENHGKDD